MNAYNFPWNVLMLIIGTIGTIVAFIILIVLLSVIVSAINDTLTGTRK